MKLKIKSLCTAALLLVTVLLAAGCGQKQTPYQVNDAENYTVSVKYDANGGVFTTNTSVIVDSYNLSEIAKNSEGMAEIALLSPDNSLRGNNAFTAINNGYFLAGWYIQCVQSGGSETTACTYSGKWNFETDRLTVDPTKTYTSFEPVLTLYAAWVPLFAVEYYDLTTGELLATETYNPTQDGEIALPQWDEESGTIRMNDVPQRDGYTFNGIYTDAAGTQAVNAQTIAHPGILNEENATAENATLKLYTDWMEGEWYHIYNAEQFADNASVSGSYVLHADLDFTDEIWPSSLMYGSFTGIIQGNGHTISNVTLEQTNNSKVNAGLFGQLAAGADISDLIFENVTFTIKAGTRVTGTSYGLLAGTVSTEAKLANISILSSTLQIHSGCYFGTDDYVIGLLCGTGSVDMDLSGITCAAVGDTPENVSISVTGNTVTVEFITQ